MKVHSIAVASLAGALVAFAATPAAADVRVGDGSRSVVVRYHDLDTNTEVGAESLYRRVVAAARRVCPDTGVRDLNYRRQVDACRQEAISRAIDAVGSPKLAAVLQSRRRVG
jgi:UrcA family protein